MKIAKNMEVTDDQVLQSNISRCRTLSADDMELVTKDFKRV